MKTSQKKSKKKPKATSTRTPSKKKKARSKGGGIQSPSDQSKKLAIGLFDGESLKDTLMALVEGGGTAVRTELIMTLLQGLTMQQAIGLLETVKLMWMLEGYEEFEKCQKKTPSAPSVIEK